MNFVWTGKHRAIILCNELAIADKSINNSGDDRSITGFSEVQKRYAIRLVVLWLIIDNFNREEKETRR